MRNKQAEKSPNHRDSVRSYVIRSGRMTDAQRKAMHELFPHYGITPSTDSKGRIDIVEVFGRKATLVLEVGFGNGEALIEMAGSNPECDFIGIEVHEPGLGHLLLRIHDEGLGNIRVILGDAVQILSNLFLDQAFDRICLFFPDPWPKKRHNKRRILSPHFVGLMVVKLKVGGEIHFATDWQDYAEQALQLLENEPALEFIQESGFANSGARRPMTKFEQRGRKLGHDVWDIIVRKRELK
ncbi:MAG: tRNA (guanosine(46)-N7)-methyltransferase TrmB [Gammaproteobacteria bacterium]|nr:tRNA (guanosine(46)-N7)-methyltransferase TrmB [Gammaproteobacteria bacterium]MCY4218113.1 tRNA (guanosine(46)-N7)-methyltransferase TrmB [Gammaproteobacteria bacterium]MCY4275831.1 tRNA (guanosine(46)-N7)-methyltransferase TrmB [Gammaproteobacteria bacterium]